jgi:hypothetical protein
MSALNALLLVFAGEAGVAWQAYDRLDGVHWHDPVPVETPEVADPGLRFSRSGRLLLLGFGDVELPDADDGLRFGNEGESGFTLNGDAVRVEELVVVKFFPSDDPAAVLRAQAPQAQVVLEAEAMDAGRTRFHRIALPGIAPLHAETCVEDDFGPGSTLFVFRRARPERRMSDLRCRWLAGE